MLAWALPALVVALSLVALSGCRSASYPQGACERPDLQGCPIEEVAFEGTEEIDADDLAASIATAETRRTLFGTVVVEYETFDRFVLERDLARVERYYRARGYYGAHVRAARVLKVGPEKVRVEIAVDPGAVVTVSSIGFDEKAWSASQEAFDAFAAASDVLSRARTKDGGLGVGAPFDEAKYDMVKRALVRAMTETGFAYAKVEGKVDVDLVARTATIVFVPTLGPRCTFGPITVRGTGEIPEASVLRAIGFEEGDRFSTAKLEQAEYALAELGVFSSVEIQPLLAGEGEARTSVVPVRFTAKPGKLRSVKLGVGATIGAELESHLVAGWEDRNFLGGLRRLSIEARPGLVLYPTSIAYLHTPTDLLPQIKSRLEFRQPQLLEARTTGIVRVGYSRFRAEQQSAIDTIDVCYRAAENGDTVVAPECAIVGYDEYTGTLGVERYFDSLFTSKSRKLGEDSERRAHLFYLAELAHWQIDDPFSFNNADPPSSYEIVSIRHLETLAWFDYRLGENGLPDPLSPNKGVYVGMGFQYAGGFLGGDTSDVRLRPELRLYAPITSQVTLGLRGVMGLLFPRNYGTFLEDETPAAQRQDAQAFTRDVQLFAFRGFFSGGPYSNRGYPTNSIGPRVVPDAVDSQLVVAGGRTLWESTLELRFPIVSDLGGGTLGGAVFGDASDVTRGQTQFRLTHPHVSVGFGLRYDTPVGPLRADVGYRVPCLQITGTTTDSSGRSVCNALPSDPGVAIDTAPGVVDEGDPGEVFGLPIAFSIVFGEAF